MFSEPLAKIKNETKIKTSLRSRGPPGVPGRILRIGRISSDWSDVDYCEVFISCFSSYSDGTHSLQRIHWWNFHFWVNCSCNLKDQLKCIFLGLYKQPSANISGTESSAQLMLVWFYSVGWMVMSSLFRPVQLISCRSYVINQKSNGSHAYQSRNNQSYHSFSKTTTVDVV